MCQQHSRGHGEVLQHMGDREMLALRIIVEELLAGIRMAPVWERKGHVAHFALE